MNRGPSESWTRRINLTFYIGLAILAVTQAVLGRVDHIDIPELRFTATAELVISALGVCLWIVTKPTGNRP
jgi:hypothetical protein